MNRDLHPANDLDGTELFEGSYQARLRRPGSIDADASDTQTISLERQIKSGLEATAAVAAEWAKAVDQEARFPLEAFRVAREQRLLGMMVPAELGGAGATIGDVVDACYLLARSCASTAMIFAMHQIMVAILVRHARGSAWHARLLQRLSAEQLLLASSTTEGQSGGDLRTSLGVVERAGSRITLTKSATVVSYGAHADAILITARRAPDALSSDQVLVTFVAKDYRLEPIMNWDTLGMRGTCSCGFELRGEGEGDQVLPVPYQKIQSHTMMPVAHLTWSAVWTGIAAGALERARRSVRAAARRNPAQPPLGLVHLTRASMSLRSLRTAVKSALEQFEAVATDDNNLESLQFQNSLNLLKVSSSELAIDTVMRSMQACGLPGYRNDGEFSLSRHLRDALSSQLMINNERIINSSLNASMLIEAPLTLRS